jgi:phage terminase large subunit-like protein
MIEHVIRSIDPNVSYKAVRASRGKVTRAEPISALYEQGKVSHVGTFTLLEDQMCSFTSDFNRSTAGYSPDRLDALVWALSELMLTTPTATFYFG